MENRQATVDCPVCGARHSGLATTPARDPRWPYRIECPVTCIQIPARFDGRGEVTIDRKSVEAKGKAAPRHRRRVATSMARSR